GQGGFAGPVDQAGNPLRVGEDLLDRVGREQLPIALGDPEAVPDVLRGLIGKRGLSPFSLCRKESNCFRTYRLRSFRWKAGKESSLATPRHPC
ncbi:MAG TPA: hypothetical protein PLK84_05975, partial [Syntrophales bacterium]|nr:hypothetical protein [Syntrophales bacterium]